jgi:hypothetical protein
MAFTLRGNPFAGAGERGGMLGKGITDGMKANIARDVQAKADARAEKELGLKVAESERKDKKWNITAASPKLMASLLQKNLPAMLAKLGVEASQEELDAVFAGMEHGLNSIQGNIKNLILKKIPDMEKSGAGNVVKDFVAALESSLPTEYDKGKGLLSFNQTIPKGQSTGAGSPIVTQHPTQTVNQHPTNDPSELIE